jgi:hypothetical protein
MAVFLRYLDPIMQGDSGAVLSSCIASGDATTLEEVAIVEAFITNLRRRPETVAVLRLEPTASQAIRSTAVEHHQGQLHRKLLGALKLMAESGALIVPGVPASYMPVDVVKADDAVTACGWSGGWCCRRPSPCCTSSSRR